MAQDDELEIVDEIPLDRFFGGIQARWVDVEDTAKFIDLVEGEGAAEQHKRALAMTRRISRDATINKDFRLVAQLPPSVAWDYERRMPGCLHNKEFLERHVKPTWGVLPKGFRRSFLGADLTRNSRPSISTE